MKKLLEIYRRFTWQHRSYAASVLCFILAAAIFTALLDRGTDAMVLVGGLFIYTIGVGVLWDVLSRSRLWFD